MNKDYTIVIHTDTPSNFDKIERVLLGAWDVTLINRTTREEWRKEGTPPPETSTTASTGFVVVPDDDPDICRCGAFPWLHAPSEHDPHDKRGKTCEIPACGCTGEAHP